MSKKFALTLNEDGYGPSDHSSFMPAGARALFWTGNHEDITKAFGHRERSITRQARVVAFVEKIVPTSQKRQAATYTVAEERIAGPLERFFASIWYDPNYAIRMMV